MRNLMNKLVAMARRRHLLDDLLRRNPLYYGAASRTDGEFAAAAVERRVAMHQNLLARALGWARRTPRGRAVGGASLADWPLLTKEEVRDAPAGFRRAGVVSVPASTGGTSGLPLLLSRSLRCIAAEQAFLDNLLVGTGPGFRHGRVVVLRGENVKDPSDREPPFGIETQGGRRLVLSAQHLAADTVAWYARAIENYRADLLWIYPSTGEALARHVAAAGLSVKVPAVLSSSEMLHDTARAFMADIFSAEVIDLYGMAERVAMAVSRAPGAYVFNGAYGHVELLDTGQPAPPGLRHAEIVATGFWNDAMPLVRYRTGDYALYPADYDAEDLAAVAVGLKPVRAIAGRDMDYLISPRGDVLVGIDHFPRDTANILRMQVIQHDPVRVDVDIVTAPAFSGADLGKLKANIANKLPADMQVSIRQVDALQRSPSGKVPFVIRHPAADAARKV
jgi:phenylacetate-CoA ligase